MYADISFQNVKLESAYTFDDLASVPFTLKFDQSSTGDRASWGNVTFHLENADLARALVKAINDVLADFAVPSLEVEAA